MKTKIPICVSLLLITALPVLAQDARRQVAQPRLRLSAGDLLPLAGEAPPPGWYQAASVGTSSRGKRYLVAIARRALGPEERAEIEACGAELLDYLPDRGYRLRLAPGMEEAVGRLPFISWLGTLPPWFKIDLQLASRFKGAAAEGESSVRVLLFADEADTRVLEALSGLSAHSSASGKEGAIRLSATIPAARLSHVLSALAALPEVEWIEPVRPVRALNQDAVWVHQSFVGPSPQQTPIYDEGIFGCGQTVGFADTGQDYDICYFRDTVNGPPPIYPCAFAPCQAAAPAANRRKDIIYYNWSGTPTGDDDTCPATLGPSGHGTHVSGSIAGDQGTYADCTTFSSPGRNGGDGLAPGAKLVVQEMGDGYEYLNYRGGTLWNLADVAYQNGARIHSNSWGGACYDALGQCVPGCEMPYDSYARDADLAMWSYPDLLIVTAAGNGGAYCPPPVSVGTPATAKSVLSVGSVGHGASAGTPSWFTSPGPVFDGRLKPTLAAQGESMVSAASDADPVTNNCSSCSLDGSSMSAPAAAGLAALVREYYAAGFYAAGTRTPLQGFAPSAALVKATLIDGAAALGVQAPAPDFTTGYGRILLDSTLAFAASSFKLRVDDHQEGLVTGGVVSHAYDVAPGSPFRASLVWTDYPAALGAAVARVNELMLEVADPTGNIWFQTLDAVTGAPVQTSSISSPHDSLNVEERLVFGSPAAGRWVVRVRGLDVPWGPQPFALVVRGALSDCVPPASPGPLTLATPAPHEVRVSWSAVPGAAAYNVYRSFGSCPGSGWIPVATGVAGTSFVDSTVSGGVTYSYYVAATSDSSAACESPRSPCSQVVPTGDCFLAPTFRGISSAASSGLDACSIDLSWSAASSYCPGDVRYNVYRSISPAFVPAPSNRIARCVIGTSYSDSADLASGSTYYYVVHAEDGTTGHGGACHGGNEEGNLTEASATPDGPPGLGTFSDDAGDTGSAKFSLGSPWTLASTGGSTGPKVYTVTSNAGLCSDLTSPVITLADPGEGPQLSFKTKHTLDYDPEGILGSEGSLGQVEIATGPSFNTWTRVPLTPDYPALVQFPYNNCPTTQSVRTYFSGIRNTYTTYSASLTNWAGGDVQIRFHLSGDNIWYGGSWWVDDIAITKAIVPGACTTTAAGPPPVPDGAAVPGAAMRASRSAGSVIVTWDATQCPASAVNIYQGALGNYAAFTAGNCNLPSTGSATLLLPDNVWFLVAATDGASTDGSWGRYPNGAERSYTGASIACPAITLHVTNNGCP